MFIQHAHGNPEWIGEDYRGEPKGCDRCDRCGGPLCGDDEIEFGVCLDCCRAEAQQAFDDECDRLATEAAGLATADPWVPEPEETAIPW